MVERDPNDSKNVLVEIRAGTGGDEAALFAGDLFKMLTRYAEERGFATEVISQSPAEVGGFKEVTFGIKGDGAYSVFKYEGGTHRVQRVPATESQGRIHTSTATVAVLPEAEEVEIEIDPNELQIDVYRSSGPGGQSVNTTDSAVRITHQPTGIVVSMQDEKSQLQNKERAMRVLRARLYEQKLAEQQAEIASERRAQVGSGERSEKIRTYNFPQGRVTDHRIKHTSHNLDGVLGGRPGRVHRRARRRGEAPAARGAGRRCPLTPPSPSCRRYAAGTFRSARGGAGRGGAAGGDRGAGGGRGRDAPASTPRCCSARPPGWSARRIAAAPEAELPAGAAREFAAMVRRRLRREPVAYILGSKGFRGIEVAVDRRVLIPRPESELLVEVALELGPATVLDVGTGSGAVALAIAAELAGCEVTATDTSPGALEVARANARRLGLERRVRFVEGSVPGGRGVRPRGRQPPLRRGGRARLARSPEISSWEPPEALFAGADGLEVLREVVPAPRRRGEDGRPRGRRRAGGRGRRPRRRERLRLASRPAATSPASSGSWWRGGERDGLVERDGAAEARAALERCVASGGVAVFPADGLYGLACDPLDAAAIERIHRIKGRDDGKPSAVLYFSPLAMREMRRGPRPAHPARRWRR